MTIKKTDLNSGDIYAFLGITFQIAHNWRVGAGNTQTKGWRKYKAIARAGELFGLSYADTEKLANKAGLSMLHLLNGDNANLYSSTISSVEFSAELFPYDAITKPKPTRKLEVADTETPQYTAFLQHFNALVDSHQGKKKDLCEDSLTSERMFRNIRNGINVKKEPLVSLLLTMKQPLSCIQECLKMAGFILSKSIISDVIIMWMLEDGLYSNSKISPVYRINTTLDSLGLPLLMTRNIKVE